MQCQRFLCQTALVPLNAYSFPSTRSSRRGRRLISEEALSNTCCIFFDLRGRHVQLGLGFSFSRHLSHPLFLSGCVGTLDIGLCGLNVLPALLWPYPNFNFGTPLFYLNQNPSNAPHFDFHPTWFTALVKSASPPGVSANVTCIPPRRSSHINVYRRSTGIPSSCASN